MADLLIDANAQATAARAAGQASLMTPGSPASGPGTAAPSPKASTDNTGKTSQIAKDGRTLARRFRDHEDMILRFATDLAVGFTSNQAERDVRPVKVQQRTSGGTWRTLARTDRLRDRPLLPVHHRQMGHRRPRRPHLALREPALAPARNRTTHQHARPDRGPHPRHQRPHNRTTRHQRALRRVRTTNISRPLQLRLNS